MKFPDDVPGWLTQTEGECLAAFAEGQTVLEIGSYCGRSTVCMAQGAKYLASIDPRDARATTPSVEGKNTLLPFVQSLYGHGLLGKVAIHIGTTETVAPHLPRIFTRVFIDGAHDYASVKLDMEWATKLLLPSGLVACHDYRTFPGEHDGRWDAAVTQAIDESIAAGWQLLSRAGTVAILRPAQFAVGAAYRVSLRNGTTEHQRSEALTP